MLVVAMYSSGHMSQRGPLSHSSRKLDLLQSLVAIEVVSGYAMCLKEDYTESQKAESDVENPDSSCCVWVHSSDCHIWLLWV